MFNTVALVGATGAVGRIMRELLEQRPLPARQYRFLASARSAGSTLKFRGHDYTVEPLTKTCFGGVDLVIATTPDEVAAEFLPAAVDAGDLPLGRAYRPSAEERLIRETILQLKRGYIRTDYFQKKFGVDVRSHFAPAWASLKDDGYLAKPEPDRIALTRDGLLRVDLLIQRFFLPEHRNVRYT